MLSPEFLFDLAQARIVFQKDKGGKVQQFVWNQGGADQTRVTGFIIDSDPVRDLVFKKK